jgi:hypothetical protein
MTTSIQTKLTLFAENAQTIKKDFVWQNTMTRRLAALLYALAGRSVDVEAIRDCYTMMKNETGVFSTFRGNMALCIAAMLSLKPNPQEAFLGTKAAYDMLKGAKFWSSDHLAIAAYQIAANTEKSRHAEVITRTRAFYEEMNRRHFFLTGADDTVFAVMLGLSDVDVTQGSELMEQVYQRLKPEFFTANSVQGLAQILVLSGSDDGIVDRVLALKSAFRNQKLKLDKMYTAPSLGVLALLPTPTETLVSDIAEAQTYLRGQKGFSAWSVDTQQLLLCAAGIVASDHAEELKDGVVTAALTTSITNIIIAQEAAMIAAISASTAAASSASN